MADLKRRGDIAREIEKIGVVVIVRLDRPDGIVEMTRALERGGCRALEITLTVPGALDAIAEVARSFPNVLLGAGTVREPSEVEEVVRAGARYVVSPIFDPEIVRRAHALGVPAIPGCFSPSELYAAHRAGAELIKLFPATGLGPRYLRDVLGPFPELKILPTGGINAENLGDWLKVGARAVGVGTALVDPKLVERGAWDELTKRAERVLEAVAAARR